MIFFLIFMCLLLAFAFGLIVKGFYEFYVEEKQDRKNLNRATKHLHLKHLNDINHQPK